MANNHVYIISGEQGEGKTTRLKEIVDLLQQAGIRVGGFIAEGTWKEGIRNSFSLLRIGDRSVFPLCQTEPKEGYIRLKRFWFNPKVIERGEEIIKTCLVEKTDVIVLDEIGIFELEGNVWHDAFLQLLETDNIHILISVRNSIKNSVIQTFKLKNYQIYTVTDKAEQVVEDINKIRRKTGN